MVSAPENPKGTSLCLQDMTQKVFISVKRQAGSNSVCTPSDRWRPGQRWEGPGNVE